MSGLRADNNRYYIAAEYKLPVIRPVENKIEFMLRMRYSHPAEVFVCKPSDAFKLTVKQQSCIYRDSQNSFNLLPSQYLTTGLQ